MVRGQLDRSWDGPSCKKKKHTNCGLPEGRPVGRVDTLGPWLTRRRAPRPTPENPFRSGNGSDSGCQPPGIC